MKIPSISIALATYNGEKYLEEQLKSIEKQSMPPSEIIISDDVSTDSTLDIIERFKERVKYEIKIKKNRTNAGYRRNFLDCAKECQGDIIIFCDQDDIWRNDKIHEIIKYFSNSKNLAVTHDCSANLMATGTSIKSYFHHLGLSGFNPSLNIKGCCMAYRRELIELVGFPSMEFNWGHDNWISFTSKALNLHGILEKQLIDYRIHSSNTSGVLPGGRCRIRRLLRSIKIEHFSTASQLEDYVSYYVKPTEIEMHHAAIDQFKSALSEAQRRHAYDAISNREKVCHLWQSEAWQRPAPRTLTALRHFFTGAYRSNDGVLGLMQDIYGDRHGSL